MGVDHRRRHILVAEQFLHRADVVATCEQVRGKRMPQRMRRSRLDGARVAHRLSYSPLNCLILNMMPPNQTRTRINGAVL